MQQQQKQLLKVADWNNIVGKYFIISENLKSLEMILK